MSRIDRTVSNQEVIPVVTNSRVFAASPESRLSAGILAIDGRAAEGLEAEYAAHFQLRRRVYVDQTAQLAADELDEDGTDRDQDDARSVTFAVFEQTDVGVRIVGVSRLIVRGDRPLPVEEFCPDAFGDLPLRGNDVEVSRVIARHEKAALQDLVQWQLFALMLAYIPPHGLGRTFAIIEPWLERHLRGIIALERIGDVRYIAHYLDYNVPMEIDIPASTVCVNTRNDSFIAAFQAAEPGMAYFGRVSRRASSPLEVDA
ncbi:hypothetical protein [Agreia bicolorata]|uniref:GNAT family N-acetyltransferase n=1 Tax=Agreia bicolorata TaxID=110935 RepID=A0ABR5CEP4_9MICO|nr:hypothetical protein [Agreia bicolorata]KJC64075.1 hypothetical protein TZ00_11050 [Agreia bicolorata]